MDFPEISWLLCDTTIPHPLAPERSSKIVPLFALFSDGAHGGGWGRAPQAHWASLWLLLLSFHTKFWLEATHPLVGSVGIPALGARCQPKLTTSKAELTTTLQSWPPVVVTLPESLASSLPPGLSVLHSSQLLFHQAMFITPLRCGASIHQSPSATTWPSPITTHSLGLHSCLQPDISRDQLCPHHGDPGQVMALSGSVSSPSKGLTPPWLPVQWTPQAHCCCEVTDGEPPGRYRGSMK